MDNIGKYDRIKALKEVKVPIRGFSLSMAATVAGVGAPLACIVDILIDERLGRRLRVLALVSLRSESTPHLAFPLALGANSRATEASPCDAESVSRMLARPGLRRNHAVEADAMAPLDLPSILDLVLPLRGDEARRRHSIFDMHEAAS
jgi:hypothetical protein